MSLAAYRKKRDFKKTPEPAGKLDARHRADLRYVIQKHDASRLHYDFRLEWDGTLKSWAVPKGPSLDPARKALAVQVEDHPIDYGDFEGVIPKGQYGGGTVLLWDKGTWEPLEDAEEGLRRGKLRFALHGEKLQGEWALVRMHGKPSEDAKNWLLIKKEDEFSGGEDVLRKDQSVKTGRSMEKIAGERDDVWDSEAKKTAELAGAKKGAMPEKLAPQLAELAEHPPEGDAWIHEIKFDGYRLLAFLKDGEVVLRTRTGLDWTAKFGALAARLAKLKVDSAIMDGEVVALDEAGRSNFEALQAMLKKDGNPQVHYFAFDLPFYNGVDLRETPLLERKRILKDFLDRGGASPVIAYSDHVRGDGEHVIKKACALGSEGIVSKRADAPYVSRRDASWVKSKCHQRQEFVIVGYTPSTKREGLRSLLLGYHDPKKGLVYGGRAGTGFDAKTLKDLRKRLAPLERESPPTDVPPPVREQRGGIWVEPKLVCEVRFTGWTRDGVLRHPAYMGLRLDKPAEQVKREVPVGESVVAEEKTKHAGTNGHVPRGKKEKTNEKEKKKDIDGALPEGVRLTHPDKVLYPDEKVTKQDIAAYYGVVQRWMLPHVAERPLALVRCPSGIGGTSFFMRNWSESLPPAVDKVNVGEKEAEWHIMIHDVAGLLSLVQVSALEIHTWNCVAKDVEHPDQIIFDLDPGPGVAWKQIVKGAEMVRKTLTDLRLPVFLKTTGGKGLHLVVPIRANIGWAQVKEFCRTIAVHQAEAEKDLFVANMRKELRGGKIYLDYLRNGRTSTAVAPFSTRARPGAAVSMPLAWEELAGIKSADQFTVKNAARHLEERGSDPWSGFERSRVDLGKIVQATAEHS